MGDPETDNTSITRSFQEMRMETSRPHVACRIRSRGCGPAICDFPGSGLRTRTHNVIRVAVRDEVYVLLGSALLCAAGSPVLPTLAPPLQQSLVTPLLC